MPATDLVALAFDKALTLHRQGRLDDAIERYEAILVDRPDHVRSLCCLCLCRLDRGHWNESLRLAHLATSLAADSAEAWHCLGSVQRLSGDSRAAATSFLKMLTIRADFAEGHNNLGKALIALNRPEEACRCLRTALTLKPDFAEAYHTLGTALEASDHFRDSIACQEKALRIDPANADAHYGLANSLAALTRHREAIGCYARAIAFRPDFAEALNNLGNAFQRLGRHLEATEHLRRAIACRPDFAKAYNNLGSALQALDRTWDAESCYRTAIALAPDDSDAHYNIGLCLTETGHLDVAHLSFERAIALAPERVSFYRMLAESKRLEASNPHFRRMKDLAQDMAALPESERMELHFALAKAYEDCADHERSFHHLLAGNRLKRRSVAYDEAATLASFDRIRTVFTAERLASAPQIGMRSQLPICIVGMPRSGTTLVEQILASHPYVFGAGELQDLPQLVKALRPIDDIATFPEIVGVLPAAILRQLGATYCDRLRARAPKAECVVDKMLANFKRIGLIHLILPEAHIIHVRRDPLDTCLACFSKLFPDAQPYAYDLAELGRYYRAYEALMAHWRLVLPPGVMLEVRYEDVVADMEGQARSILTHCDLDWDDRCLAFHKTQRLVRTASAAQVRQPLYRSSVGRWHIYRALAQPLVDALEGRSVREDPLSPSWPDS